MVIIKLFKNINKISFSVFLNVLIYCLKRFTPYKASKKEINLKKLVLCIDKLKSTFRHEKNKLLLLRLLC